MPGGALAFGCDLRPKAHAYRDLFFARIFVMGQGSYSRTESEMPPVSIRHCFPGIVRKYFAHRTQSKDLIKETLLTF